ncbi:hypothetical protein BGZ47_004753 [Haplosporangium gracile]|nr:hypothetical protein BGZ47_004753 [Haplosporangium gracile]
MDDDTHSDMHRRSYSEVETLCSEHSENSEYESFPLKGCLSRPQSIESLSQFNTSLKQQQQEEQEQKYKDTVGSADGSVVQGPGSPQLEDLTPISPLANALTLPFPITVNSSNNTITTTTELNFLQMTERESIWEPELTGQQQHQQDGRFSPTSSTLSLSTTPSIFEFSQTDLDDPQTIMSRPFTNEDRKIKMSRLFSRAASNGDLQRIVDLLDNFRDWVDLEYHEDDGTTPLIYAACFGYTAVAFMLLDAGALIDARDRSGWTALVWATNNKNEHMVRLLLEHGASTKAMTTKGRTIADFLRHDPNDTTEIARIFQEPAVTTWNRNLTVVNRNSGTGDGTSRRASGGYDPLGIESFEESMSESEWQYRLKKDIAEAEGGGDTMGSDCSLAEQYHDDDDGGFDWECCLPDQMFVFSSNDISHIIDTTITTMDPTRSRTHEPVPAYVIFLAARFAHYFSSPELLDDLLEATLNAIEAVAMGKPDDMALSAYWISNTTALLHFLRKDLSINTASKNYHPRFEALLIDMTQMVILDVERRIEEVLGPAMLDHDTIVGLDEVKFQSDWAFWRGIGIRSNNSNNSTYSNSKRASAPPSSLAGLYPSPCFKRASFQLVRPSSPRQRSISPRSVTTMLSSLLYLMQTYDIHMDIVHYMVIQVMYYIACEIFNRIMDNRTFLTRSKALQTRLNLSILEDWLRNNQLPSRLAEPLMPLIQLLQLLQVLSLQGNLMMWIETRKKLELLNPAQVKHVVSSYRYEVNERRLPAEVTKYVLQVVADTEKVISKKPLDETLSGSSITASFVSGSGKSSRRNSSQAGVDAGSSSDSNIDEDGFGNSISSTGTTRARSRAGARAGKASGSRTASMISETEIERAEARRQKPRRVRTTVRTEDQRRKRGNKVVEEDEEYQTSQTKDSMVWIHFTLPTNLAAREGTVDRMYVPQIPEDMVSLLDSYGY